jgi:hypothetical protein
VLGGAAASTTTYHGTFADLEVLSAPRDPFGLCTEGPVSGIWNVRFPAGADIAYAHVTILKDGRAHARWTLPFRVVSHHEGFVLVHENGGDVLTLTLEGDALTYTLDANNPVFECEVDMTGFARH